MILKLRFIVVFIEEAKRELLKKRASSSLDTVSPCNRCKIQVFWLRFVMMPKSKRKEKFLFLKQILEETSTTCDKENDRKKGTTESSSRIIDSVEQQSEKQGKERAGPTGKYPVLFKKTCKNKSCQTRMSAFPLFPLPEETEWISDGEVEKKKKSTALKRKRKQKKSIQGPNKNTDIEDYNAAQKLNNKVKNSDGTRKDFRSEHQLKDTDNPVLQAWLHKKTIVARKQRKLQRKERQAKRAALEEEARIKAEREIECNEKVGEWFKRKRKEARISWRKNRSRVEPQKLDGISQGDSSAQVPPPQYRVFRSFQHTEPTPVRKTVLEGDPGETNKYSSHLANEMNKTPIASCSKADDTTDTQENCEETCQNSNDYVTKPSKDQGANARTVKCRPMTAVGHTESLSCARPKTATMRPKTARENSSKITIPSSASTKKMQSLSYDEWLKVKQEGDKIKEIQKKRELIDSHLEAVIKELGKKRVEKILSPRKQVDTGLKNSLHSTEPVQSTGSKTKKGSQYRWITSKNPRPEPQGCDYPETKGTDGTVASCNQQKVDEKNAKEVVVKSNDSQTKQPKAHVCQEVDAKYNELRPSIEKVKDILDAEIKKLKESGKHSEKELNKPNQQTTELPQSKLKSLRPASARPSTTRPTTDLPAFAAKPSSAHLTEEQSKKIAEDLDILGLCGSDPEQENNSTLAGDVNVEHDQKSTVRENYFDYGSEVD